MPGPAIVTVTVTRRSPHRGTLRGHGHIQAMWPLRNLDPAQYVGRRL